MTSSQEALLAELDSAVEELRSAAARTLRRSASASPHGSTSGTGRAIASVNIPLADLDFRDRMRERHGLPVAIDNDGNAAAIAEWKTGAAQGASYVVMLTLGTGVGGGLILDGRPYRGATGSGAELGHIVVDLDGPPCGCGGRGHLESVASGQGGEPRGAGALRRGRGRPRARASRGGGRGRGGRGDGRRSAAISAPGSRPSSTSFEPELIVIGGGFGEASELLLGPAREVLARDGLAPGRETASRSSRHSSGPTPA